MNPIGKCAFTVVQHTSPPYNHETGVVDILGSDKSKMPQATVPLIRTKIQPPPRRSGLLRRERLARLLDEATRCRVTIVSAPAGFGKTTLLAEWAADRPRRAAWVSLDEHDGDIVRFLEYIVAAIRRVDEGLLSDLGSVLAGSAAIPPNSILAGVVNELADAGRDIVLVLDDHHDVASTGVFEAIAFLIDHGPASLHLVLAGREDPPLPLPRYRVEGTLAELRTEDLRFTRQEAQRFFGESMGLQLAAEDVDMLDERTEGWAASLQLAAVSLQGRTGPRAFIDGLAASDRYVIDYLLDEVLGNLPEATQRFLQRTSVLERLSPELCDSVLGHTRSAELIAEIERRNLFLTRVVDNGSWFRYHQLFRTLLRQRLDARGPKTGLDIALRASEWCEKHGDRLGAFHYALAAGEAARAADLAAIAAVDLVNEGHLGTVLEWTDLLGDVLLAERPMLTMARAWTCFLTGRVDEANQLLQVIDASPESEQASMAQIHAEALRAFLALNEGRVEESLRLAMSALDRVDDSVAILRSALAFSIGLAFIESGDTGAAETWLVRATESGYDDASYYVALAATCHRVEIEVARGHLRRAEELSVQAMRMGVEWGGGTPLPATGYVHAALGEIALERNEVEAAKRHFDQAAELGKAARDAGILIHALHGLSVLAADAGDIDASVAHMERLCALLPEAKRCADEDHAGPWLAQLAFLQGDMEAASKVLRPDGASAPLSPLYDRHERLVFARIHLARGDYGRALAEVEQRIEQADRYRSPGNRLQALVLKAAILEAMGQHEMAIATLDETIGQGRDEGYVRSFLKPAAQLLPLLSEIASGGENADYAEWLLSVAGGGSAGPVERGPSELLTTREHEVLGLLAADLTYQEIADRLYVSLNTVRTHTKNVYAKLGANTRVGALSEAGRRDLL